jgi:hypothetical protein
MDRDDHQRITDAVMDALADLDGRALDEDADDVHWFAIGGSVVPGDVLDVDVQDDDGKTVARYRLTLTEVP